MRTVVNMSENFDNDRMETNLDGLIIKFNSELSGRLTDGWKWLLGENMTVIMISSAGDLFLESECGHIYWLDTGRGIVELIATDMTQFENRLEDPVQVNEWFLTDLIKELRSSVYLNDNQVYSYKLLPVLGGKYTVSNFAPIDIEEHFSFIGDVHEKIKDLPDGTKVIFKVEE